MWCYWPTRSHLTCGMNSMWQIVGMLRVRRHESWMEWIYTCKYLLRSDHELLWKTLRDRVKVMVRSGMEGWSFCLKRVLLSWTAFSWIQLITQNVCQPGMRLAEVTRNILVPYHTKSVLLSKYLPPTKLMFSRFALLENLKACFCCWTFFFAIQKSKCQVIIPKLWVCISKSLVRYLKVLSYNHNISNYYVNISIYLKISG